MSKKKADGWSEAYPYDFYVYKDDSDACPECGRKPVAYQRPSNYHNKIDTQFICVSDHKWIKKLDFAICHWCNQEGTYEDDEYYADMTIWWCDECLREHGQDMAYQEWQGEDE